MDIISDLSGGTNDRSPAIQQDKSLVARFYWKADYQSFKSEKEGRPIFEDKEYIEIFIPGDKTTEIRRPATQEDRVRFEKQYQDFQNNQKQGMVGTPLEQWPLLMPAQIMQLKAMHVYTVEQLSEISDTSLQKIGPGTRDLQQKAIKWLESAKENKHLAEELEARDKKIDALEKQVEELMKNQKKKPGRRPKETDNAD